MGHTLSVSNFWAHTPRPSLHASGASTDAAGSSQAVLSTWRHLLDAGTMQDGEPYLAATARDAVVRVSSATAKVLGLVDGRPATVSHGAHRITAPVIETPGMVDGVVWIPANSQGGHLGVPSGTVVNVSGGAA